MSRIQLKTDRGRKALVLTNIAYVAVDMANSLILEAEALFKSEGLVLQHEPKRKLAILREAAATLKARSSDFTLDAYAAKDKQEVENYCNDADFLAEFLLTAVDRSGGNPELLERMYKEIKVMPTKMHLLP